MSDQDCSSSESEEDIEEILERSEKDKDGTIWLPTLYDFNNNDALIYFKAGYNKGNYYSVTGVHRKKNGDPGKPKTSSSKVKINNRSKTLLEASKMRAIQEWKDRIRNDTYKEYKKPPKCTAEEWRDNDPRRHPALCKRYEELKGESAKCDEKHKWIGQPKANGDRLVAGWVDDEVKLYSRKCREKNFLDDIRNQCGRLIKRLAKKYPELGDITDFRLDGEMYAPSFKFHQHSRSVAGRSVNRHKDEDKMRFHIFDLQEYTLPFRKRCKILWEMKDYIEEHYDKLIVLPYRYLSSVEEIIAYREECKADGFEEGIVLRRPDILYTKLKDYRHNSMIKFKYLEDDEFKVVGFEECEGDQEGCVKWIVRDLDDKTIQFGCKQVGTFEYQKELFQNGKKYIGKIITVEYGSKSAKGIPIFPVAIRFREEDDLPRKVNK